MTGTLADLAAAANDVGVIAVLVLGFLGFARGWIVTRREHAEIIADRDYWRATCERLREADTARSAATDEQTVQLLSSIRKLLDALPSPACGTPHHE